MKKKTISTILGLVVMLMLFSGCGSRVIGKNIKPSDIYSVYIGGGDGMTYSSAWHYYAYRNESKGQPYIEYEHWDDSKNEMITERFDITGEAFDGIIAVMDGCKYVKNPKPNTKVMDAPGFSGVSIGYPKSPGGSYHVESPDKNVNIKSVVINAIREAAGLE